MRLLALISLFLISMQAQALEAKVSLDRSWGLLVGDLVTETVKLPLDTAQLDSFSLPQNENRYGPWLYLHNREMHGNTLILHYQIINVPAENREVATPKINLRTASDEVITVPSAPMQIGWFMIQKEGQAFHALVPRGDMRLKPESLNAERSLLWLAIALLILSSLTLLAWHLGLRPRHRLPFAQAMFELNKMRLLGRKDADTASRTLHHAFNRSAGRVVVNSDMTPLWQKCPWLEPVKADIDSFYQTSAAHFFSPSATSQKDFDEILKLARACRVRERVA